MGWAEPQPCCQPPCPGTQAPRQAAIRHKAQPWGGSVQGASPQRTWGRGAPASDGPRRGLVWARGPGEEQEPCSNPAPNPASTEPCGSRGARCEGRGRSGSSNGHSQRSLSSSLHPGQGNKAFGAIRVGFGTPWVSMTMWVSGAAWGTGTPALCSKAWAQHQGGTGGSDGEEVM